MTRPRIHAVDDLLDVAEQIVTSGDSAGLTLRALAAATGASNGTIYHAFGSKDVLLARLWLRAANRLGDLMFEALGPEGEELSGADAVAAVALASVELLRRRPASARLFFSQRRDQLFSDDVPPDVESDLVAIQKRFLDLLVRLARGAYGRADRHTVEAVSVCVVDLPSGILRRRLLDNAADAEAARLRLDAAVRAVLAVPLPPRSSTTRKEK